MRRSGFASWFGGRRKRAASHPHVNGRINFYHPILDAVGQQVGCARLSYERNDEYAARLVVHITASRNATEALLNKVQNYKR